MQMDKIPPFSLEFRRGGLERFNVDLGQALDGYRDHAERVGETVSMGRG